MDEDAIRRELVESQSAVKAADEARVRRQNAVMAALDAGWSRYKIGKTLGAGDNTVVAIIKSAGRSTDSED